MIRDHAATGRRPASGRRPRAPARRAPGRALLLLALACACGASGAPPAPVAPAASARPPATSTAAAIAPAPPELPGPGTAPRGGETPEEVAAAMSRAARVGDAAAYLGLVATADPIFLVEQRSWARDLSRKRPLEIALALEGTLIDGDVATGPLRMTWRMPGDTKARVAEWPARFVRRAPGDVAGGWFYAGEDWAVSRDRGVVVLHAKGLEAAARVVAEVLPGIRERVHAAFGMAAHGPLAVRPQEVKLYPSLTHLQASIYPSYTAPLAGWNEPGESIKLLGERRPDRRGLASVLAHEYAHVATFELGPDATDMPWWALEGIAELVSREAAEPAPARARIPIEARMRARARAGRLVRWEKLADFFGEAQEHAGAVYAQGHALMAFVTERHGKSARKDWLARMANGRSLDAATREALGIPFDALDQAWRASIGAR